MNAICIKKLGDNIVLSGAVVYLAQQHGSIIVCCPEEIFPSVRSLYANYTNILTVPYSRDQFQFMPSGLDYISFCQSDYHNNVIVGGESWVKYMYRKLGVDFKHRYDLCPVADAARHVHQVEWPMGVAMVHDLPSSPVRIFPRYPIEIQRVEDDGSSILRYCCAIEDACELHFMDSSFMNLAECLQPTGGLYIHRYVKPYLSKGAGDCSPRHNWIEVKDPFEDDSHTEDRMKITLRGLVGDEEAEEQYKRLTGRQ
jgi:hypothetical protein